MSDLRSIVKTARFAIAFALSICLVACSAILGLTDPTLDNSIADDGGSGDGSTTPGDGQAPGDGGKTDAAPTCAPTVDLTTDKLNCGACGHDCLGGLCVASQCQAVVLASNQDSPFAVTVDAQNIYWANYSLSDQDAGTIATCPLSGCANPNAPTILASTHHPAGIALDTANNLYWTSAGTDTNSFNDGNVGSCSLPACATKNVTTSNLKSPSGITAQNGSVFFTTNGTSDVTNGGVWRATAPALGGLTQIAFNQNDPDQIAANASFVYWDVVGDNGTTPPAGIARCPLTGACGDGGGMPVATADLPFGLALSASTIFWGEFGDGTVQGAPLAGGLPPALIAGGMDKPFAVATDGTNVYIVAAGTDPNNSSADGKILRCVTTGCASATVIIDKQDWPHGIAVDDKAVYWVNFYGGQIMKIAK
jgi:hypothetical protein